MAQTMPHSDTSNQRIVTDAFAQDGDIGITAESFLIDRQASGKAAGTVESYRVHLTHFTNYCEAQALTQLEQLTADILRRYLLFLAETHNQGGVHIFYRTLRAFLHWVEFEEVMPADWRNPIRKVKAPHVDEILLDPVPLEDVNKLIASCTGDNAKRDRAILRLLLDTGVRAGELCNMDRQHVDMGASSIAIAKSKSRKPRFVYFGKKTRHALRAYLRTRHDHCPALFVSEFEDRLSYNGLREILRRRSRDAGIPHTTLHRFRHAFVLEYLRNGGDLFTLQKQTGHSDLRTLKRYAKLADTDAQNAHAKFSPADKLKG